jgi:hypothetical protein
MEKLIKQAINNGWYPNCQKENAPHLRHYSFKGNYLVYTTTKGEEHLIPMSQLLGDVNFMSCLEQKIIHKETSLSFKNKNARMHETWLAKKVRKEVKKGQIHSGYAKPTISKEKQNLFK